MLTVAYAYCNIDTIPCVIGTSCDSISKCWIQEMGQNLLNAEAIFLPGMYYDNAYWHLLLIDIAWGALIFHLT